MSKEINEAVERGEHKLVELSIKSDNCNGHPYFSDLLAVIRAMRCEEKPKPHGTEYCAGWWAGIDAYKESLKTAPQDDDPILKVWKKWKDDYGARNYKLSTYPQDSWQAIEQYVKAKGN
jgi:hypothetical protein